MAEVNNTPIPTPQPPAKKRNPWLIALVVILVLCCFCVGAIGLLIAFGQDILTSLASTFSSLRWYP